MKNVKFLGELAKRVLSAWMGGIRNSLHHIMLTVKRGFKQLRAFREYVETLKFISKILLGLMSLFGLCVEVYLSYNPWQDVLTLGW